MPSIKEMLKKEFEVEEIDKQIGLLFGQFKFSAEEAVMALYILAENINSNVKKKKLGDGRKLCSIADIHQSRISKLWYEKEELPKANYFG